MKKPLIAKDVKHYGDIGAGRVIPFVPRDVTTTIYLPDDSTPADMIGTVRVKGNSLEDLFIFDDDTLIFSRKFTKKQVTPKTVCVLYVHSLGELMAKKVLFDHADQLTLRSSGGGLKDVFVEPEDVDIWGIAIGMQRLFPGGQVHGKPDLDSPF